MSDFSISFLYNKTALQILTRVCEFDEMYFVQLLLYQHTGTRYIVPGTSILYLGVSWLWRLTPTTRTLTLTLTLTRMLWGDLCLDAVACGGYRLIRPKGGAVDGG